MELQNILSFCALIVVIAVYKALQLKFPSLFKWRPKSSDNKVTNITPVSLLEVKVTRPTKLIFGDDSAAKKFDPNEMAQLAKTRLGEGMLGTLFKVVLNCGSISTIRKVRDGLVKPDVLEFWVKFFGGIHDVWLLPIQFSFWYGGEAFILYEYVCLGSLEELLHVGTEGYQFTPLNWKLRLHIALCAAMAVASIHSHKTKEGKALICGVIKSSNIMIRIDFSACLSGYETPYLVPSATIIRRNPGRIAPELASHNSSKAFTHKSDVYSFGILLLELITGEKPSVTNLEEYVEKIIEREGLKGICDKKIADGTVNINELVGIAQCCLVHNPNERPSMNTVVQMIQGLQ